jgi:hypothetical protein
MLSVTAKNYKNLLCLFRNNRKCNALAHLKPILEHIKITNNEEIAKFLL